MELQAWMIDYIESKKWDDDIKQDLYTKVLEMEDKEVNKTYLSMMYYTHQTNAYNIEQRRRELIEDNRDAILRALGMEGEAEDPSTIIGIRQELGGILEEMSPLLRATLDCVVLGGETPEELAEDEGVNPNTIYQRVWQIKQQLRGITND